MATTTRPSEPVDLGDPAADDTAAIAAVGAAPGSAARPPRLRQPHVVRATQEISAIDAGCGTDMGLPAPRERRKANCPGYVCTHEQFGLLAGEEA